MWLLALTFLPFLSLFQSARMLREVIVTMDSAEAFIDFPMLLEHRRLQTSLQDPAARRRHLMEAPLSSSSDHPAYNQNLHIVISHCDQPIDWIWRHYLWNQPFKSMTILTKCRRPPTLEQLPPAAALPSTIHNTTRLHQAIPLIQILELPNVGRCDHSYAYWISKLLGNVDVDEFVSYSLNFTNDPSQQQSASSSDSDNSDQWIIPSPRIRDIYDSSEDLILFMKDNDNAYRANMDVEVPLHHMMESLRTEKPDANSTTTTNNNINETMPVVVEEAATGATFACGTKLRTGFPGFHRKNLLTIDERERASNMANRRALWTFQQGEYSSSAGLLQRSEDHGDFISRYRPMGQFVKHLQYDLQAFDAGFYEGTYQGQNYDLVPVCFGGNFMTSLGTIQNSPVRNWTAIVDSLSRGDNIEEGHYMERLWAHLFSPAFSKEERKTLLQRTSRYFLDGAFAGMMVTLAASE
jgi:hypothetical protein